MTVTRSEAERYRAWRTAQADGRVHRLPSEAEWEKAARGPGSHVDTCGRTGLETRDRALFARRAFEEQEPALGAPAPDLCRERLDGRPWSLAQQFARTVVLVKASFT